MDADVCLGAREFSLYLRCDLGRGLVLPCGGFFNQLDNSAAEVVAWHRAEQLTVPKRYLDSNHARHLYGDDGFFSVPC